MSPVRGMAMLLLVRLLMVDRIAAHSGGRTKIKVMTILEDEVDRMNIFDSRRNSDSSDADSRRDELPNDLYGILGLNIFHSPRNPDSPVADSHPNELVDGLHKIKALDIFHSFSKPDSSSADSLQDGLPEDLQGLDVFDSLRNLDSPDSVSRSEQVDGLQGLDIYDSLRKLDFSNADSRSEELPDDLQEKPRAIVAGWPKVPSRPRRPNTASLPRLMVDLGLHIYSMLAKKVKVTDTLSRKGPFTVFGPTDEAFIDLPPWLEEKLVDPEVLEHYLRYHILDGTLMMKDIQDEMQKPSSLVGGMSVRFNIYPNATTVQCAPLDLKSMDHMASNGVLHELTRVMVPPTGTIMATLDRYPHYKALVALLNGTSLTQTLDRGGPFTLFAPTDDAFDDLPDPFLKFLTTNATARMELLNYHVTSRTYCSSGLVSYPTLTMINGDKVKVTKSPTGAYGHIWINDAAVLVPGEDDGATNGVIQSLNKVLVPPDLRLYLALYSDPLLSAIRMIV